MPAHVEIVSCLRGEEITYGRKRMTQNNMEEMIIRWLLDSNLLQAPRIRKVARDSRYHFLEVVEAVEHRA